MIKAAAPRRGASARDGRRPRTLGFVYRRCKSAAGRLGAELRRQRLSWQAASRPWASHLRVGGRSSVAGLRRSALLWFAGLGDGAPGLRVVGGSVGGGASARGGLFFARVVRGGRAFGSVVTDAVVEGRHAWPVMQGRIRVARRSKSVLIGLAAAERHQRVLVYARLVHLRRTGGSRRIGLQPALRRKRFILSAHLVRASRTLGAAVDGLVAEGRRQRPALRVGLVRVTRKCRSAVMVLVAAGRGQRLALRMRLIHARRLGPHARVDLARVLVVPRRRSRLRLSGFHRPRIASTATRAPVTRFPRPARGVLAGVALAPLAVSAVVAMRNVGPSGNGSAAGSGTPRPTDQVLHGFLHLPLTGRRGQPVPHNGPRATKHVEQAPARTARRAKPKVAQRMTLVSNTVQAASIPAAPAASTTAAASHNTGPSALPAPPGGSGPSPLKAP